MLLLIGGSGYLGAAVGRASGDGTLVSASRRTGLDVTDRAAVLAYLREVRPAAVINAVAALGNAGGSPADNWPVNVRGAGNVAVACAEVGARLVHVSSDALHGGRPAPYTEADDPSPVFPYGAAKAAGEAAVSFAGGSSVLVRTSLLVSDGVAPLSRHGSGGGAPLSRHEETALAMARGTAPGALFTDEIRCPVPVGGLAAALLALARSELTGVVNVAGLEAMSRHDLGVRVARAHGLDPSRVPAAALADSGLVRPAEIRLDCSLVLKHFPDLERVLTL